MRNGFHGGLAGKARRAHYRSRAARLYAQQQIADYFDPRLDYLHRYRNRPIPIRRRGEFVASAITEPERGGGGQLELPLAAAEPRPGTPNRLTPARRSECRVVQIAPRNGTTAPKAEEQSPARLSQTPPRPFTPVQTFSGWRFLWGCALGGAAAAVVLLVLWVTLG